MPIGFLIGLGSGLASAMLCYSAARGSPLLSTLLLLLTPLPSLLAGVGWGWLPAIAGAVVGTLVMGVLASPSFAAGYFLVLGLPVAVASYLAYLSRPSPRDQAQNEWYPVGRLLAAMSLYGGVLPVLVLPLIGGTYDILRAPMAEFLCQVSLRTSADLGLAPLSDSQVDGLAEFFVNVLPGVLAAYCPCSRSTSTWPAASRAPRDSSAATGRTWRRSPTRQVFHSWSPPRSLLRSHPAFSAWWERASRVPCCSPISWPASPSCISSRAAGRRGCYGSFMRGSFYSGPTSASR
jgi:hypothetical protein